MLMARLGLCAYLVALALVAAAPVEASDLSSATSIGYAVRIDVADELVADDSDLDDSDDDLGVDGDDDAVSSALVALPAPARLSQSVAASVLAPRPSSAIDDLFRPPRLASV
jgi:hypothetical protein